MRAPAARSGNAAPRRRGAALIFFAMIVFAFLAVAGVVLDVGIASLTQAQMQAAVDTAAIEGCRWRNYDESLNSSLLSKRRNASNLVRLVFDDDMHPTRGGYALESGGSLGSDDADAGNFAAGPATRVSGGVGELAAGAHLGTVSSGAQGRLDDPILQTNHNWNRRYGDQVAGIYSHGHEGVQLLESSSYEREDFTPANPGSQNVNALSFLVRMRRSLDPGEAQPGGDDSVPGFSSGLPRLPFVFALGSTLRQADDDDWDARRDGLTVRATAIASARPVLRVGRVPCGAPYDHEPVDPSQPNREHLAGLMPFCISLDAWLDHFTDVAWQASDDADLGKVTVLSDGSLDLEMFPGQQVVGWFCLPELGAGQDPCAPESRWPDIVGRDVPTAAGSPGRAFAYTRRKPSYIAIVDDVEGTLRVIGFGFAHVWPVPLPGQDPPPTEFNGTGTFVISAGELINHPGVDCWIAQDNASAHLNSAADAAVLPQLFPHEWDEILQANHQLAYGDPAVNPGGQVTYDYTRIRRGTVLAPVLTR
jgi:hypothetical protein